VVLERFRPSWVDAGSFGRDAASTTIARAYSTYTSLSGYAWLAQPTETLVTASPAHFAALETGIELSLHNHIARPRQAHPRQIGSVAERELGFQASHLGVCDLGSRQAPIDGVPAMRAAACSPADRSRRAATGPERLERLGDWRNQLVRTAR